MNGKQTDFGMRLMTLAVLLAAPGLAGAYAVPPMDLHGSSLVPTGMGVLLWLPLLVLVLLVACGLLWSLRASRRYKVVQRARVGLVNAPARPAPAPAPSPAPAVAARGRDGRRWRSLALAP